MAKTTVLWTISRNGGSTSDRQATIASDAFDGKDRSVIVRADEAKRLGIPVGEYHHVSDDAHGNWIYKRGL